jgi:(S)-2-hydroxyglutarate dehydrogenase
MAENIVFIIGGGIVGTATMYKIQKAYPNLKIVLFEKESSLAAHQTGHNSGVIHSGLYYKPGSYRANLCVSGRRELVQFSKEHKITHDVCGKVVAVQKESELPYLEKIYQNGLANGTEDVRKITAQELKEIEPFCESLGGLWVGCTGIIDFVGVTETCAKVAVGINENSKYYLNTAFLGLEREGEIKKIRTSKGDFKAKKLIFCGGLQSDRLAKNDGVKTEMAIVGFRGDYYELTDEAKHKVKNLIYPVKDPKVPFLGVHYTRMTNGEIECGPNAVFTFKREGYGKTDFDWQDTKEALSYGGTWKLFAKNWQFGLDEYARAFSKRLFLKRLQGLIPSLTMGDLKPGRAGVRAMAVEPNGDMCDDFKIEYGDDSIHVLNAPSPAATACLAIGEQIKEMAEKHFGLKN